MLIIIFYELFNLIILFKVYYESSRIGVRNQFFIEQGRNRSFFIFSKIHPIRRFCTNLVEKRISFKIFLTLLYISNVFLIALETYYLKNNFYFGLHNPTNALNVELEEDKNIFFLHMTLMIILNGCSAIEILTKSIANGFLLKKNACIRDPLNFIDFIFLFFYFFGFAIRVPHLYEVIHI